ncbi:subtilisin-chymotrypsin inhibitor-2B isoform X1 [Aegilops tauschii subsp. strangulata]|nr:subtilisin-chymotrypsin inhibitor-2B [Aegilops tauschii subsp. strangulata]
MCYANQVSRTGQLLLACQSSNIIGRTSISSEKTVHQSLSTSATKMSSSDDLAGGKKTSWPEVVGLTIKEAKEIILKDKPDADIVMVPVGSAVTEDLRPNRVRIFVGTVAETPHVG